MHQNLKTVQLNKNKKKVIKYNSLKNKLIKKDTGK